MALYSNITATKVEFTPVFFFWDKGFNPHLDYIVSSLNKAFYDDFFCLAEIDHLIERRVSDWKVVGPMVWFSDWQCIVVLQKDTLRLFPIGAKQSTRCGGPAWRKTCKQNPKKCSSLVRLDRCKVPCTAYMNATCIEWFIYSMNERSLPPSGL